MRAACPVPARSARRSVEGNPYEITVPNRYKTCGWLLREVVDLHRLTGGDTDIIALEMEGGRMVDLSRPVFDVLSPNSSVRAVSTVSGTWDPDNQAVSRNVNESVGLDPGTFEIDFEVNLRIGGDCLYCIAIPSHLTTLGWLLSEGIRRYMADHDDEDPGVLGLRTSYEEDLDLGDEVVGVLDNEEVVTAVSYTVARADDSIADRRRRYAMRRAARRRKLRGRRLRLKEMIAAASQSGARVDEFGVPVIDGALETRLGGFLNSVAEGMSSLLAERPTDGNSCLEQPRAVQSAVDNERRGQRESFVTLRDLVGEIERAETRETEERARRRFEEDAPRDSVQYSVGVLSDPSGRLGRYAALHLDTVRLVVKEAGTKAVIHTFKYEEVKGWILTADAITLKVIREWGLEEYKFSTRQSQVINKALLKRAHDIIARRRVKKEQEWVQAQREAANAIKRRELMREEAAASRRPQGSAAEDGAAANADVDLLGITDGEKPPPEAEAAAEGGFGDDDGDGDDDDDDDGGSGGFVHGGEEEWVPRVFKVERRIDPSGVLVKHLRLRFERSQCVVMDDSTGDAIFEWPYVMVLAWGVTDGIFVAAITAPKAAGQPGKAADQPGKAARQGRAYSDNPESRGARGGKVEFNTFAFRTGAQDEIGNILRLMMDRIRQQGKEDPEVKIPQRLSRQHMRTAIANQYINTQHSGGSVFSTRHGGNAVYTFAEGRMALQHNFDEATESLNP